LASATASADHTYPTAALCLLLLLLLLLLPCQLSVPGQGLQVEFTQPGYIQVSSKQVAAFGPTLRLKR
jgi:hypothetical protein